MPCAQLNEDEAGHGGDGGTDDMAGSADGALSGSASLGRERRAGGFGSGAGLGVGAAAEPEHVSGAGGAGGGAAGGVGGSYRQHAAMQDKKRELEQLIKERSTRIELVHSARDRCVPFVHVKIAFRADVPYSLLLKIWRDYLKYKIRLRN